MRPFIIGIGGAYSGAGKTTIACEILKRLKNWGAIKYTKTSLYSSITDDMAILSEEGKDTRRLLDAGAEKVLWVQSPYSELGGILPLAIEMLCHLKGIVVEGNSAIEILKPDIVVFIYGSGREIKRGAENILGIADVVIFENEPPPAMPESAKRFTRNNIKKCISFIIRLINNYKDNPS